MWPTWVLVVCSAMTRVSLISVLDRPPAINRSTSVSRGVSAPGAANGRLARARRAKPAISRRVTDGASSASPAATTWTAWISSVAVAAGELACFAAFLAGVAFLRSTVPHPALSQPTVLRAVVLTGAYLGLIGLGLGAIIRRSAGAIATLVGAVFVLPVLGLALTPAGKFLPMLIAANSLGAVKPQTSAGMLSPWAGLGIICLYAAVLLARRDA